MFVLRTVGYNGSTQVTYPRERESAMIDLDTVSVTPDPAPAGPTASPKQRKFIQTLLEERVTEGTPYANWTPNWERSTPKTAGQVIDFLLTLPRKPDTAVEGLPVLERARYAIVTAEGLRFYRVDMPQSGKWEGRVFVSVQASDDLYPIRNKAERERILAQIAVDPKAAMIRYTEEIGSCAICGRTLTNEDSLAAGIGPTCWAKMNGEL